MFENSSTNAGGTTTGGLFGGINNNPFGPSRSHFVINATGKAEIPFPAERALINVLVSSTGINKSAVSDEVITTAKHVESLLRDLSPKDESVEAKTIAPLAHWSKTNMTSTSHVPWSSDITGKQPPKPREYTATLKFDIRFKEFKALGAFGTRLSSLQHVEVQSISWILTAPTEKAHRSEMRKLAAQDALQRAQDYCDVLRCTNVRPVELNEGALNHTPGRMVFGSARAGVPTSYPQMQCAPGHGGMQMQPQQSGFAEKSEGGELEFRPQEVRMSMEVSVKFHATCVQPDMTPLVR